ncbi:hypothetical protein CCM_09481 [Cordyceps militaris CM01]|uniref:Uncharacterized protein n=1 Tax=Cordyceps militaris (strain CM01) TaxID=983644 RepID=G3JUQ8_CORMM|nr:uncharacterized protein CCM_09481 [Cordyceps militaris CM01]EGX87858.1 hypothetical protein CCM_09481 [Cordyceps militaris CM01]
MNRDAEPPVFRSNLIHGPARRGSHYASPPPSPRPQHGQKPIVQTSALLQLPAEIRILILVAAFGDRTIHADLDLVSTPATSRARPQTPPNGLVPPRPDLVDLASTDLAWKPTGHLCHRRCFDARRAPAALPAPLFVVDRDRCFTGGAALCGLPAAGLASCRVGALGWLLACRQAHAEGVDVLYRRNTFRLNESFALENMARIAPATSSRAAIARLSLSLTMGRPRVASDRVVYPRPHDAVEHLPHLLSLLPDAFPCLTRLHLVLAGEMWPATQLSAYCAPSVVLHARVAGMLAQLEGLMRCWRRTLQHCEVAFDSSIYFPWLQVERGLQIDFKDYADFEQCPYTVWRPLPPDTQEAKSSPTDHRPLAGYWVSLDAWDAIPWSVMTDLYGTGPW